jgi:hypothetical protein
MKHRGGLFTRPKLKLRIARMKTKTVAMEWGKRIVMVYLVEDTSFYGLVRAGYKLKKLQFSPSFIRNAGHLKRNYKGSATNQFSLGIEPGFDLEHFKGHVDVKFYVPLKRIICIKCTDHFLYNYSTTIHVQVTRFLYDIKMVCHPGPHSWENASSSSLLLSTPSSLLPPPSPTSSSL